MTNKQKEDLLKLFKSGNFSVHYHNAGQCSVYTNRFDYEDFMDDEGNDLNPGEEVYDTDEHEGYLPEIVQLLVKALGGKSGSA